VSPKKIIDDFGTSDTEIDGPALASTLELYRDRAKFLARVKHALSNHGALTSDDYESALKEILEDVEAEIQRLRRIRRRAR
jgi:hypothetical protein